jgi:hypothetical protein
MVFPIAAAVGAVIAVAAAFLAHLDARAEAEQRAGDRRAILDAVRAATDEFLSELMRETIAELEGDLEGYLTTYAAYDPDPNDPIEENRLSRLIDDSARTMGRLGALIDAVETDPPVESPAAELAFQSLPLYLSVHYLRAQAMTERQVTYGASELRDSLPAFDTALTRLDALLAYLRRRSDERFGPIVGRVIENPPSVITFYSFMENHILCGTFAGAPTPCEAARAAHMETAFSDFEGVAELRAIQTQLREIRDAIETFSVLDVVTHGDPDDPVLSTGSIRLSDRGLVRLTAAPPRDWPSGNRPGSGNADR